MKAISTLIACLLPFIAAFAQDPAGQAKPPIKISQQRQGGVIQIFAENTTDKAITVTVQLTNIVNATSDGWPTKSVKQCLPGDRVMMTALMQADGKPAATFTCTMTTSDDPPGTAQAARTPVATLPPRQVVVINRAPGGAAPATVPMLVPVPSSRVQGGAPAPGAPLQPVNPAFPYLLPYEHRTNHVVSQGYNGRESHMKTYALDFDMPEHTPVCAARDGTVIELQKDKEYPNSDAEIGSSNYIAIKHEDGTVALYAHLARDGVNVTVGQHVLAGEIIGSSGDNHRNGPHLHFEVDAMKDCIGVTTKGERGSIPVVFDIFGGKGVSLEHGISYTAQ